MSWINFKEVACTKEVLQLLNEKSRKYTEMLKKTKVSHTTLQRVLGTLLKAKAIEKQDTGHMKVTYKISPKGKDLLLHLKYAIELSS